MVNFSQMRTVPVHIDAPRLDAWLAQQLPELSRSRAAALVREGQVTVDGATVNRPSRALAAGQEVCVTLPPPVPVATRPQNLPLTIVHNDRWLVVVHKPAGMVVHPAAGNPAGTLVNALLYHVPDLSGIGGEQRPGIVHRLDKATSGLLVVAKDDATHRALAALFKSREVEKTYWAYVAGTPAQPQGTIEQPIARNPRDRKKMAVQADGRSAVTTYVVERSWGHHSLVRLGLFTGRTHQLRVHLQWLGHPIVGDRTYGYGLAPAHRAALGPVLQQRDGVFLHAGRLALAHPHTGERMCWTADEPAAFAALKQAFERVR